MDSLVSALGDSLTPSIIRVSFQRAGLYNEFYRDRCLEQLPSRVEQAHIRGDTESDYAKPSQEIRLMTDAGFIQEMKLREGKEREKKKGERDGSGKEGEKRKEAMKSEDRKRKEGVAARSTLDSSLNTAPMASDSPSTSLISTLDSSLNTFSPSSLSTFPKRLASIEEEDYIAEIHRFKILHDDTSSEDSDVHTTSSRGRVLKPKTLWSPQIKRRLPPTTLW